LPSPFVQALRSTLDRTVTMAERVAGAEAETLARQASTALYNVASAVLLAWEATRPGTDARRALIARFVLAHRLSPSDPLAPEEGAWEKPATDLVLAEKAAALDDVAPLLVAGL